MICMGRQVVIVLEGKREITAPARAGMLHDGSGDDWPECSLLIAPFKGWVREPSRSELSAGRDYFGRGSEIGAGVIDLPPCDLKSWTEVGDAKEIFYDRAGEKAPGYFRHRFHKPRGLWKIFFLVKRAAKGRVTLFKRGRIYRLDLPDGCIIDDRGIALP
jgi:hypothetical protein